MNYFSTKLLAVAIALGTASICCHGESLKHLMRERDPKFFTSELAREIGDQILLYQRVTGGWPKNIDMTKPLSDAEKAQVLKDKARRDDSTTDNNATNMQMTYLARLYQATGDTVYSNAFIRGVEFLLSGQYPNGGWPQFWPDPQGYQVHITYNDNAMVNTLDLLRRCINGERPYGGSLLTDDMRARMKTAFDKGIECILVTQIVTDGEPTVWCQQHDRETYAPAKARAYELPSYCSMESANIIRLLMTLPEPDERVKKAVYGAMRWFDRTKILGYRVEHSGVKGTPESDTRLVADPDAEPLWARYYDLENCEPFLSDRDGVPRKRLEDLGWERRSGYGWYSSRPYEIYPLYEKWADKFDPERKVKLSK